MGFITGKGEIERKYLVTYVNVGTSELPEWEAVGAKVEDSSITYNADIEKITDILGITTSTVKKTEPVQSLEPFTVKRESKLAAKLFDIMLNKEYTKLSQFDVLIAYGFAGTDSLITAEKQIGCTIDVKSLGGSGTVDMPIEINFSNNSVIGTVNKLMPASEVVFTP